MRFPFCSDRMPARHAQAIALPIAFLITLTYSAGSIAQTAPNAGQLLRELQPPPDLSPPKAAPSLRTEEHAATAPAGGDLSFVVKTIHIKGNAVIPTETLHALVADMEGATHSLNEVSAAAARITAYYREQGYPVTRAYLPPQEIENGDVTIAVVEGRIGAHKLNNRSRVSDARAGAVLDTDKDGDVIRARQIDRGLLILNDTPGIGAARATLQPGASVGTSDLVVELTPGAAYNGSIDLDNYGNRYVGEYRLGATLNINSPLHLGDVLSFNVLSSGDGLQYGRVSYQLPVGSDGLRVGAAYSDTVYQLGKEFETLDAHGKASSASLFAAYPFIRSQQANLSGTVSLEQKKLSDSVDATQTTTDKQVKLAAIGLQGSYQDGLGGGGITSASLTATMGNLDIQSPSALAIDAASAQTNGGYTRLAYALSRLQRLTNADSLSLESSEKVSLGGATGVRAYPQGEANGDEGYLASVELRHNLNDALQLILFYDTGTIRINQTPFGVAASNNRTLSGAGIGVNANLDDFRIRASIAWRTGSEQPTSVPASAVQTPTIWVQASKGF
jgi:hemolysin activation/secretion protein